MKLSLRIGLSVFFLLAGFSGGTAWAKSDAEIEEAIQVTLDLRHPTDTPEWWKSLGPEAPRIIIGLYGKTSPIYRRLRLLQALTWYDDPVAVDFLKQQTRESADDVIRTAGIRSLGISQGPKEIDFISGYLGHEDPQTRFTAGETLKRISEVNRDSRAASLYEKFLSEEKVPWIKDKLKKGLPKPKGSLTPVASSEDRLSEEFIGEWSGFWIVPETGGPGMRSFPVRIQFARDGENGLKGELVIIQSGESGANSQARKRTLQFVRTTGKGALVSGALSGVLSEKKQTASGTPTPPREEIGFDAELTRQAGSSYVQLRAPRSAVNVIVRKRR